MHEYCAMRVPQEIPFTAGGLLRVLLIAALGFAMMAVLVGEEARVVVVVAGAVAALGISFLLIHLQLQQRYGTATLIAERPYEPGKVFGGTIATELHAAPQSAIRIRISVSSVRSSSTLARTTVEPMLLRRTPDGSLSIPFHVPPPDEPLQWKPREVRLHVRTAHWPVTWGATFVIATNQ